MGKNLSKILSVALTVLMIVSALPLWAGADVVESGICGENLTWTFDTETKVLVIEGEGEMYDYEYYDSNRPWEHIIDSIKTVIVKPGVTAIGDDAFYYSCYTLTDVILPDTLTAIGNASFYCCSELDSIVIPESVTSIGNDAFTFCDGIESIELSENINHIGSSPFCGCDSLESIAVDSNNNYYSSDENGVLFNKDKTKLIQYPAGNRQASYRIPESVKLLGEYSFTGANNLKSVIMPDSIEEFEDYVFWYCEGLTDIAIPNSVTTISRYMFYCCYDLTNIVIPHSITNINDNAFNHCEKLEDVYYSGDKDSWDSIVIGENNEPLFNANIHYSHVHNYEKDITQPTCTEQGYATYTCECTYSYIGDYIAPKGHSFISEIILAPSHLSAGVEKFTCECGYTYTDTIDMIKRHVYKAKTFAPTCTEQGYTTYTCECGAYFVDDYVDCLGHIDENRDRKCDNCSERIKSKPINISDIFTFIKEFFKESFNKIIDFFMRLFNI